MALHLNGVASTPKTPSSFDALSETAKSINKASRRLTEAVDKVNAALKKLNLGIPVWIPTWSGPDNPGQVQEYEELGYAKVKGKWGICIRHTVESAAPEPDETEWQFEDAPRDMRIRGVQSLQKLIVAMNEQGEKAAQDIDKQADYAENLAGLLSDIADKSKIRASLLPKKEGA